MFPLKDNIPSKTFPIVNYLLIIINLVIFVKEIQVSQMGLFDLFLDRYGLIPSRFLGEPFLHIQNLFSSMFLHGSWAHVLGNMWFLYIFGDNVEDNLGHLQYLAYYILMGVGAAGCQIVMSSSSTVPMVGASGAIAGILGSYLVLYPRARVTSAIPIFIFIRIVSLPAYFFLIFWFLIQAFNSVGSLNSNVLKGDVGGVAWWAHAGGFLTGFVCIPFFRKRRHANSLHRAK